MKTFTQPMQGLKEFEDLAIQCEIIVFSNFISQT